MNRLVSVAIGFLLMAAYWPEWSGLATTPRWDVGVLMVAALMFVPVGRISVADILGRALVAWLITSLAWSTGQPYGIDSAFKILIVSVAFAWGAALRDPVPFIAGAAVGVGVSSVVATAQWFGWNGVASWASPGGLFWNGNRLAEATTLVLAAALARGMWWALPGLVPAIVIPYGRGAWLTAGVVIAISIWARMRTFERFVVAAMLVLLVLLAAMTASLWRTEQFGINGIAERLALWSFTISHLEWLGHGLGSFAQDGPLLLGADNVTRSVHPHNEWLWIAYEGGLPALVLLGAFAVCVWRSGGSHGCEQGARGLRLVLVALACVSLFAMPFHDPATVLFAAVVAGHLVGSGVRIRVATHDGGDPLREGRAVYGDRHEHDGIAQGVGVVSV